MSVNSVAILFQLTAFTIMWVIIEMAIIESMHIASRHPHLIFLGNSLIITTPIMTLIDMMKSDVHSLISDVTIIGYYIMQIYSI